MDTISYDRDVVGCEYGSDGGGTSVLRSCWFAILLATWFNNVTNRFLLRWKVSYVGVVSYTIQELINV